MDTLLQDLRYALRRLRRSPGFTAAAVLTLALGIGANTAIFSVVSGVLLRPLGWSGSEEIVRIWVSPDEPDGDVGNMSYPDASDLAEMTTSFQTLVAYSPGTASLTGLGEAAQIEVARVTEGLLAMFGETPVMGRDIRPDEWGPDAAQVAVISHGFWQDRFGGDPDVLGRTLQLGDVPYQVVGVAPAGFDYPRSTRLWIPRSIDPESCGRGCHTWHVAGRMGPGVTLEGARTDVERVAGLLQDTYPETNGEKSFLVRSLLDEEVGSVRRALWLLLGAVGLVLVIASANVAGLFLVRATGRQREVAVRAALGAGRGRLWMGVLTEAAVLAALGGAAGLLLAFGAVDVLRLLGEGTIPRIEGVGVDLPVLLYTTAVVAGVALLCGLIPALRLERISLVRHGGTGGRGGVGARGGGRSRRLLMAGEVALSLILLVGAGLFLRTFVEMSSVEPGFRTEGIVRFNVTAPGSRYGSVEEQRTFFRTLESRLAALPGVDTVGSAFGPPLGVGRATGGVGVEGRPAPPPGEGPTSEINPVSPGWLETYGIPLVRGRSLTADDPRAEEPVPALVNQAFVERIFPDEEPLGQVITVTVDFGWGAPAMEIVGVIDDIRNTALVDEGGPQVYPAHAGYGRSGMNVSVRVAEGIDPLSQVPAIRSELAGLDPAIPLFRLESLEEAVGRELAPTRLYLMLTGAFALVALALAAVGLYGVVAYAVSTRTREIGIRMALGADARRVLRQVMGDGLVPTGIGLGVGLVGAATAARAMEALVYGVRPMDPLVLAGAAAVLAGVAVLAVFIPARRAATVEPAITLREK